MSAIPGSAGSSGRTKVSMVLVDGLEPPRPDPAACCDQSSYGDQFTTEDLPCERGEATGCETSSPQSHLREEARVTAVHATPRRHHHLYSWSRRFLTAPARPQQHGCWPAWLLASMAHRPYGTFCMRTPSKGRHPCRQGSHLAQWQSTGLVNLGSRVRSSQWPLSWASAKSTPGGTRTHNLWLRKPTPYPLGYRGSRHALENV